MFCPKCAAQNIEGASFCRACGANISLVPQALTGQLPTSNPDESDRRSRRKRHREPSLDDGIRSLMMGVGFIVVSILVGLYSPGGWSWWYWLLIPASTMIGKGISQLVRVRQARLSLPAQPQIMASQRPDLRSLRTGELMPSVPSVTEGTTRHLGAEAPTRHFDSLENQKPS